MNRITRALRHRNYRLFFGGQSISLIGTWITRIATSWLVYRLTGSELLLGVVAFCSQIPLLILAPIAGVLVDRWDRHRILVITQILSALQSAALAMLAFTHVITVAEVIVLQLVQGVINSFDTPARQAFVVEMVADREDLPNAIALNSSMINASRIIGPSIGGVLIATVGEGWCFGVDAISYIAVIISLLMMQLTLAPRARVDTHMLDELRTGWRYVAGFAPVRALLLIIALVGVMGMPYATLMPVIASRVLHGGPHTLGILMTASGIGALMGTVYLASRHSVLGLGKVIVAANAALSLGLMAFSFSRSLWLSAILLPVVGAGIMVQAASVNTILQTVVDENLRGRVMAFYSVAIMGMQPIGSLLSGVVAERIGAEMTIFYGALFCLIGGIWFAMRRAMLAEHVRPIYIERGILPWDDGNLAPAPAPGVEIRISDDQ
ncbi:MAG TPA: MFS transporter [Thermoanaerobaculia bacterium]|nr:MFS transporter [Thermoanaerobaculia bacterium]